MSDQEVCVDTVDNSYSDERSPLDHVKRCLETRMEQLTEEGIYLAFSGGVDPSLLLKTAADAATHAGRSVYTVMFDSRLYPSCDLGIARRVAGELGGTHEVITMDELEQGATKNNPANHCHLYKHHLFSRLTELVQARGIQYILDGTNEDDIHVYRPGIQALKELGIINPLAKLCMTKARVKALASKHEISVTSHPSAPCMVTRLPHGAVLDYKVLGGIGAGEAYVKTVVPGNVRLGLHGSIAHLELDPKAFDVLMKCRKEIVGRLEEMGFVYITLDAEGFRSGSMGVGLTGLN